MVQSLFCLDFFLFWWGLFVVVYFYFIFCHFFRSLVSFFGESGKNTKLYRQEGRENLGGVGERKDMIKYIL